MALKVKHTILEDKHLMHTNSTRAGGTPRWLHWNSGLGLEVQVCEILRGAKIFSSQIRN